MIEDPKSKVTRSEAPLSYGDVDLNALAERLARGEIPLEFAVAALAEAERVFAHGAGLIKATGGAGAVGLPRHERSGNRA